MNEKRYFLKTTYNEDGSKHAAVMECKEVYKPAIEIESYTHEWRACKRIDELIKQAHAAGEHVIYNPKYCNRFFKSIA